MALSRAPWEGQGISSTLLKPQKLHTHPTNATTLVDQLHHFSTHLYRDFQLPKLLVWGLRFLGTLGFPIPWNTSVHPSRSASNLAYNPLPSTIQSTIIQSTIHCCFPMSSWAQFHRSLKLWTKESEGCMWHLHHFNIDILAGTKLGVKLS